MPPYAQYPQQVAYAPGYGVPGQMYAPPVMVPQGPTAVVVPVYQRYWGTLVSTQITADVRNFLLISGLLYLLWGILGVGLEIGIIANSYLTYYRGFWMGLFIFISGITMLVAACQANYALQSLVRSLTVALIFCILGLIFSIVNYAYSTRCDYYRSYNCDSKRAADLKIAILVVSILATIHTIVNMVVIGNMHNKSMLQAAAGQPR
jgi:hypothetical protein